MKMIQDRQKEIDDMYAAANDAHAQAEAMQAEYQQKLSTAQATSERLVKEAMVRGQAREEEIIRKANAEASAIMDKASADIAMEKKKAINEIKDQIADIVIMASEKVCEKEISAKDNEALINKFIAEVGNE